MEILTCIFNIIQSRYTINRTGMRHVYMNIRQYFLVRFHDQQIHRSHQCLQTVMA